MIQIEIWDKREKVSYSITVEHIEVNYFRMIDNDLFDSRLARGTEFQTIINADGKHEVLKIVKESNYLTRKFHLTSKFKESEYRLLGEEVIKAGGFWQVDFGGIATVNLPKGSDLDLDKIFRIFDFKPLEIKH